MREVLRRVLPAVWLGGLLCIAFVATPAPFATLDKPTAGRVVAFIFAREAPTSLALAVLLLMIERRRALDAWREGAAASQFSLPMVGALVALACTVVGYYVLQPMMEQARAGTAGGLSFGQLHGLSFGLFGVKMIAVAAMAWGAARARPADDAGAGREGPPPVNLSVSS
jgi:hypothetical protein